MPGNITRKRRRWPLVRVNNKKAPPGLEAARSAGNSRLRILVLRAVAVDFSAGGGRGGEVGECTTRMKESMFFRGGG